MCEQEARYRQDADSGYVKTTIQGTQQEKISKVHRDANKRQRASRSYTGLRYTASRAAN